MTALGLAMLHDSESFVHPMRFPLEHDVHVEACLDFLEVGARLDMSKSRRVLATLVEAQLVDATLVETQIGEELLLDTPTLLPPEGTGWRLCIKGPRWYFKALRQSAGHAPYDCVLQLKGEALRHGLGPLVVRQVLAPWVRPGTLRVVRADVALDLPVAHAAILPFICRGWRSTTRMIALERLPFADDKVVKAVDANGRPTRGKQPATSWTDGSGMLTGTWLRRKGLLIRVYDKSLESDGRMEHGRPPRTRIEAQIRPGQMCGAWKRLPHEFFLSIPNPFHELGLVDLRKVGDDALGQALLIAAQRCGALRLYHAYRDRPFLQRLLRVRIEREADHDLERLVRDTFDNARQSLQGALDAILASARVHPPAPKKKRRACSRTRRRRGGRAEIAALRRPERIAPVGEHLARFCHPENTGDAPARVPISRPQPAHLLIPQSTFPPGLATASDLGASAATDAAISDAQGFLEGS